VEYLRAYQEAETTYKHLVEKAHRHRHERDIQVRQFAKNSVAAAAIDKQLLDEKAEHGRADAKAQIETDYQDLLESPELALAPPRSSCTGLKGKPLTACMEKVTAGAKKKRLVQEVADESRDVAVVTYKHKYKESIHDADSEHKEVVSEAEARMRELLLRNRKEMQAQEEVATLQATEKQKAARETKEAVYREAAQLLERAQDKVHEEMIKKWNKIAKQEERARSKVKNIQQDTKQKAQVKSARAQDTNEEEKREALQIAQQRYMVDIKGAIRAQAIEIKQLNAD
jgi:hypothetical protein